MSRKLIVSFLALLGFGALGLGSMSANDLEDIIDNLD
jgi:hypothetical protein